MEKKKNTKWNHKVDIPGTDEDFFEDKFAKIEGEGKRTLRAIVATKNMPT